jgi:hypothetical protein
VERSVDFYVSVSILLRMELCIVGWGRIAVRVIEPLALYRLVTESMALIDAPIVVENSVLRVWRARSGVTSEDSSVSRNDNDIEWPCDATVLLKPTHS